MECAEETRSQRVCSSLYNYYMLTEQMDKVKQLLQVLHHWVLTLYRMVMPIGTPFLKEKINN